MSEDPSRRRPKVHYYVANPSSGESDDSDDTSPHASSVPHPPYAPSSYSYPNNLSQGPSNRPSQPYNYPPKLTTDLHVNYPHYQPSLSHPSLSSPSSTSSPAQEETPPPTTPGLQSSSVDPPSESPSFPHDTPASSSSLHERPVLDIAHSSTSRAGKLLQHIKSPFVTRGPRAQGESAPRRPRTSPTVSTPDSYSSTSSYASSATVSGRVLIVVTVDFERYVTVDVSGAKSSAHIRECIFNKLGAQLRVREQDSSKVIIHRTEIGATTPSGDPLSEDQLFALCRDHGDSKGTLKFFISCLSPGDREPPPRPLDPPIPTVTPFVATHSAIAPLRAEKHGGSRRGSVSSINEQLLQEVPPGSGYEADLDNPDTHRLHTRTQRSQMPLPPSPNNPPPSPHHPRRPSGPARPSSPLHQTSKSVSPPLPTERSRAPTNESTFTDKYGHVQPTPPPPPPLSPHRPTFSSASEEHTLLPPPRLFHLRSGSDAGVEFEKSLKASEQQLENAGKQWRNRELNGRLKTEPSREALSQWDYRYGRRQKEDDSLKRTDSSWVLVSPDDQEPPQQERAKPSPSAMPRSTRPQLSRFRVPPHPQTRPPPVPSSSSDRPSSSRTAGMPIPNNFVVAWKGEEHTPRKPLASSTSSPWSRLNKGATKSMDNLRGVTHPANLQPGKKASHLPLSSRPSNSTMRDFSFSPANVHGMPKSYEPPRTNVISRPLPVHGPVHSYGHEYGSHLSSSQGHYTSRAGLFGTTLMSPNHDPYIRPQSAMGGDSASPSTQQQRQRTIQSPTTYGSSLEAGDSNQSSRTMSPSRYYSHAAIPGPRPRPTHSSDRSSDNHSGPETSTPPRTPISPLSPRHPAEKNGYLPEPSSPLALEDGGTFKSDTSRSSDATVTGDEQNRFAQMLKEAGDGTCMPSHLNIPSRVTTSRSLTPPLPSTTSETNLTSYGVDDDDDDDSEGGGGTWIVRPTTDAIKATPPSPRPPLKLQIETPTPTTSDSSSVDLRPANGIPPVPSTSVYQPPVHPRPQKQRDDRVRASTFGDENNDTWAPRPPPEVVYNHLEEFFPEHDLDKPVIESSSGGTSPTAVEPVAPLAAPPPPERSKMRSKKSIRVVAEEHKQRASRVEPSAELDMRRKRSTKMWGSKLEEVTTHQAKSITPSTPESPPGGPTTFKWVRGELIGKGTYGRVYLAMNATTGEMIAVKQVELPQTASDRSDSRQHTVVQALKLESETLKDLDHPNIVQYLGFEETPSNLSIFLEYVPGGSIGSCLHKYGKFRDDVTRSFTSQILSGLEYLHSKGILHRDLKADNILVMTSGVCKISDFGISKRTEDNGGAFTAMQGTVFWMAPEVINTQGGKGYNFKIDIWSVGCVVLEMWAGMRPWIGEETVAVMFKLYQAKLPPPVPDDVVLSDLADDFRRKCFAINPDERPTASELKKHPYLTLPPDWEFTGFT
ncbi:hypothetical protein BDQ17DRAFT_1268604 [Cyathus striatus]|nr:hypothetical protein BDQ17DRAFT_1268604 [Cyathus striatus]